MDFFLIPDDDDREKDIPIILATKPKREPTGCCCIDYGPASLDTIALAPRIIAPFKSFIKDRQIPYHINIQGATGSGKWTVCRAIIYDVLAIDLDYGCQINQDCINVLYKSNVFITDFNTLTNLEASKTIKWLKDLSRQSGFGYKVLILKNIDKLPLHIQYSLCKLYDYSSNVRIVTTTSSPFLTRIHPNLRGRAAIMKLPRMYDDEINEVVATILGGGSICKEAVKVYRATNYNLRDTLLIIQGLLIDNSKFKGLVYSPLIIECLNVCSTPTENISNVITADVFARITQLVYSLNILGVSAIEMFKAMLRRLLKHPNIPDIKKSRLIKLGGDFSRSVALADKPVFHMEWCVIKILEIISQ